MVIHKCIAVKSHNYEYSNNELSRHDEVIGDDTVTEATIEKSQCGTVSCNNKLMAAL